MEDKQNKLTKEECFGLGHERKTKIGSPEKELNKKMGVNVAQELEKHNFDIVAELIAFYEALPKSSWKLQFQCLATLLKYSAVQYKSIDLSADGEKPNVIQIVYADKKIESH